MSLSNLNEGKYNIENIGIQLITDAQRLDGSWPLYYYTDGWDRLFDGDPVSVFIYTENIDVSKAFILRESYDGAYGYYYPIEASTIALSTGEIPNPTINAGWYIKRNGNYTVFNTTAGEPIIFISSENDVEFLESTEA